MSKRKKPNQPNKKQSCVHIQIQAKKCHNTTIQKTASLIWQLQDNKKQKQHRKKTRHHPNMHKKRVRMQNHSTISQKCMNIAWNDVQTWPTAIDNGNFPPLWFFY